MVSASYESMMCELRFTVISVAVPIMSEIISYLKNNYYYYYIYIMKKEQNRPKQIS